MVEWCCVMHCWANDATGAQRLFNDYNNLQSSNLTTNRAVTDAVSQLTIGIVNWSLDRLFAVRISLNQPRPTRLWMTSQLLEVPD